MNTYVVDFTYYNENSCARSGTHVTKTIKAESASEARAMIKSRYYKVVFHSVVKR